MNTQGDRVYGTEYSAVRCRIRFKLSVRNMFLQLKFIKFVYFEVVRIEVEGAPKAVPDEDRDPCGRLK